MVNGSFIGIWNYSFTVEPIKKNLNKKRESNIKYWNNESVETFHKTYSIQIKLNKTNIVSINVCASCSYWHIHADICLLRVYLSKSTSGSSYLYTVFMIVNFAPFLMGVNIYLPCWAHFRLIVLCIAKTNGWTSNHWICARLFSSVCIFAHFMCLHEKSISCTPFVRSV